MWLPGLSLLVHNSSSDGKREVCKGLIFGKLRHFRVLDDKISDFH